MDGRNKIPCFSVKEKFLSKIPPGGFPVNKMCTRYCEVKTNLKIAYVVDVMAPIVTSLVRQSLAQGKQ